MSLAVQFDESVDRKAVALKAFGNVMAAWDLSLSEAAGLADMSDSTWKRAKKPNFAGDLTRDQMLRISAVIGIFKSLELYFGAEMARNWMRLTNTGPLFHGARPVDAMIEGGLPMFLQVRAYLDALRGGV